MTQTALAGWKRSGTFHDPSPVRSEKFAITDSSDGGGVAMHYFVLMLEAMALGAPQRARALRAQFVNLLLQADDAHDDVGASVLGSKNRA